MAMNSKPGSTIFKQWYTTLPDICALRHKTVFLIRNFYRCADGVKSYEG